MGLSKLATLGSAYSFITFIDDCTCMAWVVLMKNKSDMFFAFQKFHKMRQFNIKAQVQVLRSDNG